MTGVCFVSLTRRLDWRLCESIGGGSWRVSSRFLISQKVRLIGKRQWWAMGGICGEPQSWDSWTVVVSLRVAVEGLL